MQTWTLHGVKKAKIVHEARHISALTEVSKSTMHFFEAFYAYMKCVGELGRSGRECHVISKIIF